MTPAQSHKCETSAPVNPRQQRARAPPAPPELDLLGEERAPASSTRTAACGYSLGAKFTPSWMDWPMFYEANPWPIAPGMVFFAHMILMDSIMATSGFAVLRRSGRVRHSLHDFALVLGRCNAARGRPSVTRSMGSFCTSALCSCASKQLQGPISNAFVRGVHSDRGASG
jgi:hypothetical protein